MKKKFLATLLLPLTLISCSTNNYSFYDEYEYTPLDESDNYRTFYEIFPSSYYDSNGDGNGDLQGIIQKLDYIDNMGFNGIWLTPIHESPSYHGYDVNDYYSINPKLGTMDDYRELVEECHKRDIKIILDLVLNHTSPQHEWFQKGVQAFKEGNGGEYSDYYNFSLTQDLIHNFKYDGVWYESGFGGGSMPDLNLDSENVRREIEDIIKFYIDDVGIDGFRLDAVPWYFKGDEEKNIETLSWINKVTKSYNENAYIVAEAWEGAGTITRYYESGIDSFFAYNSNPLGVEISRYMVRNDANSYVTKMEFLIEQAGEYIPAPFITNHDNPRSCNVVQGRKDESKAKFGQGIMQMMSGATFTYYGDEIGMMAANPPDENVRTAMLWGEEEGMCNNPSGTTQTEIVYPTVAEQMEDENSILVYYRNANRIRDKYPAIRKGSIEIIDNSNKEVCFIKKDDGQNSCYLLINFGLENNQVDLSKLNLDEIKYDSLLTNNEEEVTLTNRIMTLPKYAIVVIQG